MVEFLKCCWRRRIPFWNLWTFLQAKLSRLCILLEFTTHFLYLLVFDSPCACSHTFLGILVLLLFSNFLLIAVSLSPQLFLDLITVGMLFTNLYGFYKCKTGKYFLNCLFKFSFFYICFLQNILNDLFE